MSAKKQNLSENQARAADPAANVWVQANAGTGKTSVLVQRLLRILFRNTSELIAPSVGGGSARKRGGGGSVSDCDEASPRPASPDTPLQGRGESRTVFAAKFLFDQPAELRMKFLSRLIQRIGNLAYPPRLEKIRRALILLENNCKFTIGHCIIRRLGNKILIATEGAGTSFREKK